MCILFLYYLPHGSYYRLIVANNRDEVFERPTEPATFWKDHSDVLAGRDLKVNNGGTWFGITVGGRFSTVTNFVTPPSGLISKPKSKGHLVSDYLVGNTSPLDYCKQVDRDGHHLNGFSLLTADLSAENKDTSLAYTCNYDTDGARVLDPGVYGLGNSLLDNPWHKVKQGMEKFSNIVKSPDSTLTDQLFNLLSDCTKWPDPNIPNIGCNEEYNNNVSAIFMKPSRDQKGRLCGTRSQTVLLVSGDGDVTYTERSLQPSTAQWTTVSHTVTLKI